MHTLSQAADAFKIAEANLSAAKDSHAALLQRQGEEESVSMETVTLARKELAEAERHLRDAARTDPDETTGEADPNVTEVSEPNPVLETVLGTLERSRSEIRDVTGIEDAAASDPDLSVVADNTNQPTETEVEKTPA